MPYKDLEKRKEYHRRKSREWVQQNPEKNRLRNRDWYHKNKEKDRERHWLRAGYPSPTRPRPKLCELCENPPNGNGVLHLDHDHTTGEFRGWLCATCNMGLGKLGDSIEGLERALVYLKRGKQGPSNPHGLRDIEV